MLGIIAYNAHRLRQASKQAEQISHSQQDAEYLLTGTQAEAEELLATLQGVELSRKGQGQGGGTAHAHDRHADDDEAVETDGLLKQQPAARDLL